MSEPRTVDQLLHVGERVLTDSTHLFEEHDHQREAEQLLAYCLRSDPAELDRSAEPDRRQRERFLALIARRAAGEPMPFLTGAIDFYGLELRVRPGPFVPRPSSELTVEWAVKRLRKMRTPAVVDVCTGAGPIALAIAHEVPVAEVWGTDIAEDALALARANARRLGLRNIRFRRGDMYAPLPARLKGRIGLITGHVPYVPAGEVNDMPTEVIEHEPMHTLTDRSHDGMYLMRRAVQEGLEWLMPSGWLLLEMADDFAPEVERLCIDHGMDDVGVVEDDDQLSVVVEARAPARAADLPVLRRAAAVT